MSGDGSSDNGNRTVFRPSPLAGMRGGAPAQPSPTTQPPSGGGAWGAPPPMAQPPMPPQAPPSGFGAPPAGFGEPPPSFAAPQPMMGGGRRLNDDDIPVPSRPRDTRSPLVIEAGTVLALAASVRSGRARISMPDFHREAMEAVAAYDRAIAPLYPEETRMRARYGICATIDDIAQNLPGSGNDGAEWARRSLVVSFFRENIGGDRFWQLVDDMLARPGQNAEVIELYADCLAAGFEGRFRVMPDGRARLQQILTSLYGALEHPRSLSQVEVSPMWRGADAPLRKISPWSKIALAAAAALALLLAIYIVLRLLLMTAGSDSLQGTKALMPQENLRLSRVGAAPPPAAESDQLVRMRTFLEPEVRQNLVVVEEDGSTVRVRTTVGQLFQSGSDRLEPGRADLFERIGRAVEAEPGQVTIEGHSDSDQINSLAFPDNTALSQARAQAVAGILGSVLSNPGRISVEGYGDGRPIADNGSAEGKALNRRVEVIIPRQR
ncbi:MAG: type IV secretion protein DotU [Novosphingobium sp. 17-62-19]|uniref:type IVB secretion system protein IcmH/DotU n=1 Tax=Novosphingobium sp. 17-62-19 TaxID=1970406 RepID=UPI000BD88B15|nr:type IVB secretion system protein IcmH/DotU [Novosphingobium sp. 17-62-19]OYX96274.1 MAG: type IV secretion protein DotU [Novosphingobium sp. 35-62-5]OZA21022.1 MAG: type IV secretion protein DotU [Novosphingobium sp. 17-62-19]HQS95895.1 type IVB secretion system protein IcmH/DotU [Novosphingobium sp.]